MVEIANIEQRTSTITKKSKNMKKNLLFFLLLCTKIIFCMEKDAYNKMDLAYILNDTVDEQKIEEAHLENLCKPCEKFFETTEKFKKHKNRVHKLCYCKIAGCPKQNKPIKGRTAFDTHISANHSLLPYFFCANFECKFSMAKTKKGARGAVISHSRGCLLKAPK